MRRGPVWGYPHFACTSWCGSWLGVANQGKVRKGGEEKTWVSKEKVYENTFYIILPTCRLTLGNHPNHFFLGFHLNSHSLGQCSAVQDGADGVPFKIPQKVVLDRISLKVEICSHKGL